MSVNCLLIRKYTVHTQAQAERSSPGNQSHLSELRGSQARACHVVEDGRGRGEACRSTGQREAIGGENWSNGRNARASLASLQSPRSALTFCTMSASPPPAPLITTPSMPSAIPPPQNAPPLPPMAPVVPPPPQTRKTDRDDHLFDVVIIGAGIAGLGAALTLRDKGLRVRSVALPSSSESCFGPMCLERRRTARSPSGLCGAYLGA